MKYRICAICGKPIRRGEEWVEAVGIRWHWKCMPPQDKKNLLDAEKGQYGEPLPEEDA